MGRRFLPGANILGDIGTLPINRSVTAAGTAYFPDDHVRYPGEFASE